MLLSGPFNIRLEDVFDLILRRLIHPLTSLVRLEPRQCTPDAIPKGYDRFEARHETFDLAIIEDVLREKGWNNDTPG